MLVVSSVMGLVINLADPIFICDLGVWSNSRMYRNYVATGIMF